ncbi:MAG: glutathione peroxidase [Thermoleophilia bacterium]|nr:glutathione peroxidase [Thermoleophilia bacterium]
MAHSSLRRAGAALALAACAVAITGCGGSDPGPTAAATVPRAATPAVAIAPADDRGPSLLRGRIELIDGEALPLSRLRGRVVLAVNTASRCGYTPQFEGLEALHESRAGKGLAVIGFPSNDFRQELADDGEIAEFCELNYGVGFPMAASSRVTGAGANPLFAAIAARPGPAGEPPDWNFEKYLLDRSGRLVARFDSSVEPDDPALLTAVDALLDEERQL